METNLSNHLEKLLRAARSVRMNSDQKEEQRRSFAFGNAGLENELITREMVDEQAERLKKEDG